MKLRFPILLALAGSLLVAGPASASERGAQRAVKREICFDWECAQYGGDIYGVSVLCNRHGRAYYTCSIQAVDSESYDLIQGKARVKQIGKHYHVNYRLHW